MKKNVEVNISQQLHDLTKSKRFTKRWIAIVSLLAVIVFLGVNVILHYSGQALNHSKYVLNCGESVHQHTDACYELNDNQEKVLICGESDWVVHTHNEYCYDTDGNLICELPEIPGHAHDESCYEERKILICPIDTDNKEAAPDSNSQEVVQKQKSDNSGSSVSEVIINTEEVMEDNVSEDTLDIDSLEKVDSTQEDVNLDQGNTAQVHVHDDSCYSIQKVLVCKKVEMHEHTVECYKEDENGNRILICDKQRLVCHIHDESCIEKVDLSEEEIVALNLEDEETETLDETEDEIIREYKDDHYYIRVSYHKDANIPDNAELIVKEITNQDELFEQIEKDTNEIVENASIYASLDIGFYVDGEEIEPEAEVEVVIQFIDNELDSEEIAIIHNKEEGSTLVDTQQLDVEGQISFTAESFSIYTFVTVDKNKYNYWPVEGRIYAEKNTFDLSYNSLSNAFLTDTYKKYRNENGALGSVASSFHIVALDYADLHSHINGNILAKTLYISGNDWGTNAKEGKGITELSYIQNIAWNSTIGSYAEQNGTWNDPHMLVVGSNVPIYTTPGNNNKVHFYVGGSELTPTLAGVVKDVDSNAAPFINISQVESEIRDISKNLSNYDDQNIYYDFSDNNNKYILLTNPNVAGYLNLKVSDIQSSNTIKLLGFTKDYSGNALNGSLIINVDCSGYSGKDVYLMNGDGGPVYFGTQYYQDWEGKYHISNCGNKVPTAETVDFSSGKVIWNFINSDNVNIRNIQNITGAIIAPGANLYINGSVNGTIIGKYVFTNAETHRTDFTGTTIPFAAEIYASKTVDGFAPTEIDDTFSFRLEEWKNGNWQKIEDQHNVGKDITFSNITYAKQEDIGTHWYKMTELVGDNKKYQYDPNVYIIRVDVSKESNSYHANYARYKVSNGGNVTINQNQISCSTQSTSNIVFINEIQFENSACTSISVEKKWVDIDETTPLYDHLPDAIVVQLYQTTGQGVAGIPSGGPVTIRSDNGKWAYTWDNLPTGDANGNPLYYYVTESPVNGFELITKPVYVQSGTIYLTNKKIADTISIKVNKEFFLETIHQETHDIKNYVKVDQPLLPQEKKGYIKFRLYYSVDNGKSWSTSIFPVTVREGDGYTYTTNDNGTFTIHSEKGWTITLEGLPKYGVENGKIFTYQYKVKESECSLIAFPYYFDYTSNVTTSGVEPGIWDWDKDYGHEFTIFNECQEKTLIQMQKDWLTYSGNEDSLQNGANESAAIYVDLWRSKGENTTDGVEKLATYEWKADSIKQSTAYVADIASQFDCQAIQKNGRSYWYAEISNLPRYYLKSDGTLGEWYYFISEVTDQNQFTYQKYVLQGNIESSLVDGVWTYKLTNQSTEAYELPETGGKGTIQYRLLRWLKQIL